MNSSDTSFCLRFKVLNTSAVVTSMKLKFLSEKFSYEAFYWQTIEYDAEDLRAGPTVQCLFLFLSSCPLNLCFLSFYCLFLPCSFFPWLLTFCSLPSLFSPFFDFLSWFLSSPLFFSLFLSHTHISYLSFSLSLTNFYLTYSKVRESILLNITLLSSTMNFWSVTEV